jgi:hypothetical protein
VKAAKGFRKMTSDRIRRFASWIICAVLVIYAVFKMAPLKPTPGVPKLSRRPLVGTEAADMLKQAGLPAHYSPHSFRATGITIFWKMTALWRPLSASPATPTAEPQNSMTAAAEGASRRYGEDSVLKPVTYKKIRIRTTLVDSPAVRFARGEINSVVLP